MKLGDDDADVQALRASGLRATNCVPLVPSILPNTVIEGPEDVETRIEALCASMHRFARYEPDCVLCLTGPAGGRDEADARGLVIDGLRRIAAAADEAGVRLGLEPIHASRARRPDARHDDSGDARPARRGRAPAGRADGRSLAPRRHARDRAPPRRERRPDHRRPRRRVVLGAARRSRAPRRALRRADARPRAMRAGAAPGTWRSSATPSGPTRSGRSTWTRRRSVPTPRSAPPSPEPAARSRRTPRTRCRDRRGRSRARRAARRGRRSRRRRETAGSDR